MLNPGEGSDKQMVTSRVGSGEGEKYADWKIQKGNPGHGRNMLIGKIEKKLPYGVLGR